jgi:hypothetical protein
MQKLTAGKRHGILLASSWRADARNKIVADGTNAEGGNRTWHVPQAALGSVYTTNPSTR